MSLQGSKEIQFIGQEISIPSQVEFWRAAQKDIADLWERVPDGGTIRLALARQGREFRIDLGISSSAIVIEESDTAKSPFVALERALSKAYQTLHIWKLGRRF